MTEPVLQHLIRNLEAAVAGPESGLAEGVTAALQAAATQTQWIPPERRRANHTNYARHVLYGDPGGRFSVLSIVWAPGQTSPIHSHHTWCGVAVYRGILTETFFHAGAPGWPPMALQTVTRPARTLSFDRPLTGIHRITNAGDEIAISLHVYGVGHDRIASGVNRLYS